MTVANDHLYKAIAILEPLTNEFPSVPDYRQLLAQCYHMTSVLPSRGDRQSARDADKKATEMLEALVRDFPDVPDYRYDLSEVYAMHWVTGRLRQTADLAQTEQRLRDGLEITEQRLRAALEIAEGLVAEHPNVPDYAALLARIHHRLGKTLELGDRLDESQAHLEQAVRRQSSLAKRCPNTPFYLFQLSRAQADLAAQLAARGQLAAARAELESLITSLKGVLATDADWRPIANAMLADSYRSLANVLQQSGDQPSAADALRESQQYRARGRRG